MTMLPRQVSCACSMRPPSPGTTRLRSKSRVSQSQSISAAASLQRNAAIIVWCGVSDIAWSLRS